MWKRFYVTCPAGIKMPVQIKKRGRPKGNNLTVVGLPCKKRKKNTVCSFSRLHTSEKKNGMYLCSP